MHKLIKEKKAEGNKNRMQLNANVRFIVHEFEYQLWLPFCMFINFIILSCIITTSTRTLYQPFNFNTTKEISKNN